MAKDPVVPIADFPTGYNARYRTKPRLDCSFDVGRTHPEFEAECDINNIMKKYQKNGVLPDGIGVGMYGDFSDAGDFLDSQNVIQRAQEQFASLPAAVRERFRNDPWSLLMFVHDKANIEEARKLGLLKDEPIAVVPPVEPPKT